MTTLISPEQFGFGAVFIVALVFGILTLLSRSKVSVVYATFSFIFWFAEAGLNLILFQATPSLLVLSWLWFAIGVFFEVAGIVLAFVAWKADREQREMEL